MLSCHVLAEDTKDLFVAYDVSLEVLNDFLFGGKKSFSYQIKSTEISTEENKKGEKQTTENEEVYSFNPSLKAGKKYVLLEVDGKVPTEEQIENFNEIHNTSKAKKEKSITKNAISSESMKIISDSDDQLVVEFAFDKKKLKDKDKFLKRCSLRIVLDKKSKELVKLEVTSRKPFRKMMVAKILKTKKEFWVDKHPEFQIYIPVKVRSSMTIKAFGVNVYGEVTDEYSDHKKVE